MIKQTYWRVAGGISIVCCAFMAWLGVAAEFLRHSSAFFFAYWGAFFILFLFSLYLAILDLRYIRMQYALAKKELFEQTLGSEDFRKNLNQAISSRDTQKTD